MVARGANYPHQPRSLYCTPAAVTAALLDQLRFGPVLCDPGCGHGDMLAIFRARGYRALGADVHPVGVPHAVVADFIRDPFPFADERPDIVTNPPGGQSNSLAVSFIARALAVTRPYQGKVAMLLRRDFDSAPTRTHLFRDHPAFAVTMVLLGRITWFSPRIASPAKNHAWFLWNWQHRTRPVTLVAPHEGFPRPSKQREPVTIDRHAAPDA